MITWRSFSLSTDGGVRQRYENALLITWPDEVYEKRAVIFMCMRRVFLILPRPLCQPPRSFVSGCYFLLRETKRREAATRLF
jgi:hypothetical protein